MCCSLSPPQVGKLDFADISVAQDTDSLTLRGTVPNPILPSKAGGAIGLRELTNDEFVTVLLEGVEPQQVVAVPRGAVLSDQQGNYVNVQKKSSAILQYIMLYSEDGRYDPLFIPNFSTISVIDELARTPGVGQASLFGRLKYSIRIWFDTDRLTSLGLAPSDIIRAVRAQNVQAPVGRIGARPLPENQQFQLNAQTQGRLTTPEQFGAIVIRANPDGSVLRVRDVARVEVGAQNEDSETRLNGNPAVAIGIYLAPGADAVQTAAAVRATLDKLRPRFPDGREVRDVYDTTDFVNATIHDVAKTVVEAFVLVAAVVFIFLGSWRATLIPIIAVPVSLVGRFAALLALGYTVNTVSLLALVLAIGIVVDDAIVVVENVERVMEEEPDLSPAEASRKAMGQVTAPIIAIPLVLLSVFVPVGFIAGISGELFRQFSVTISAAMLISAAGLRLALEAQESRPHRSIG